MKTNLKISTAVITAMCLILSFSCKKSEVGPAAQTSPYNMYMTDAPGDYQAVYVNITGAEVLSNGVWVGLNVKPGIYNLLSYTNGKDTLIATGMVAANTVTQVRLILAASGNTVVTNNVSYPLATPSADQSGLKINVNPQWGASGATNLVIDFDAGLSIVYTGNNTYKLKPVLHTIMAPINGTIKGIIAPSYTETAVLAISANSDSVFTYSSVITGGFMIQGLASGTYKVMVMPPTPATVQTYNNIVVTEGSSTDMGTISVTGSVGLMK